MGHVFVTREEVLVGLIFQQLVCLSQVGNLSAPSVDRQSTALSVTSAISILYFGSKQWCVEGNVRRYADGHLAFLTLLRGNHHHTIGSHRAIKRRSVGTFQHVDALDVVGVNHRQRVGTFAYTRIGNIAAAANLAARVVQHGHTVNNDKYRAVTQNRFVTTQDNFRCTTGTTGTGRNGNTRHLTLKCVGHVGVLHLHQVFCLHFLR